MTHLLAHFLAHFLAQLLSWFEFLRSKKLPLCACANLYIVPRVLSRPGFYLAYCPAKTRPIYWHGYPSIATCSYDYTASAVWTTGDAEAFGLSTLLSCFTGVASICFLSYVLDTLAKKKECCHAKEGTSKLKIMLQFTRDELKSLKSDKAGWCSLTTASLETEYGIDIGRHNYYIELRLLDQSLISSIEEYLDLSHNYRNSLH